MKRIIALLLTLSMVFTSLVSCGQGTEPSAPSNGQENEQSGLSIVTTIFPLYDWIRSVLGENPANIELTLLLDSGVDLHSYQPTAEDILKITNADLFVYVGGESDEWAEDALETGGNESQRAVNLMYYLGDMLREEEVKEGMEAENEHDPDEDHDHDSDEPEYDEHIWLSLINAGLMAECIAEAICGIDPENAALYRENAASYKEALNSLDEEYWKIVSSGQYNTLLFGDRFPFRYLTEDYGLDYYAAFVGCSAETEASFETVIFLAKKVDELGLPAILTIDGSDGKLAETVRQNTAAKDQKILSLNSMQSLTKEDVNAGANYLTIMQNNLRVLAEALASSALSAGSENSGSAAESSAAGGIDVDLTRLSSTMVYAEVYNMMTEPESYIGKTVRMDGLYAVSYSDVYDKRYHACIIQDATACCAQGIEFELKSDYVYPDDYPAEGDNVAVVGVFDTYEEDGYSYCTLRNASLV